MKIKLTFLALLISVVTFAQQGINYKAIIKDDLGNVVSSQTVDVQFIILEDATNVYQETHTSTTDANGLIIVNIGEGTPVTGTFATIDWASDTTFLNTQINTGAGLVDMGITEFKTVPYALNAETANNVTGLEALDEGNGLGWRLKGTDPINYGTIGLNAIDLTYNQNPSTTSGAVGDYSIAMGLNTTASGLNSTAMGEGTIASGPYTTTMGLSSVASGLLSTAIGTNTLASGSYSTAMGFYTKSESRSSTVFGQYNVGGGNISSWIATDPLFEIGNGTGNGSRTNALTVLKNGSIIAPSFDLAEITNPKALITKEYLDTNKEFVSENGVTHTTHITDDFAVGSETLDFVAGIENDNTRRMFFDKSKGAFRAGGAGFWIGGGLFGNPNSWDDINVGVGSFATGFDNLAPGYASSAMGANNYAYGSHSTAMGYFSNASGDFSTTIGHGTTASSYVSLAIGRYNVGGGNATSWVATDPLFEVGFGTNYLNKLNALTITKNGRVGIGTNTPATFLQLTNGYDASLANGSGYFIIGQETGNNLVFDNNEIMARNIGATSTLFLQNDGGNVAVGGTIVHSSDFRLKKDITPLTYGLETILELNPVEYNWKNREQEYKSLGLIAQEVQPVIKNIVHTADDEEQTLSVSYTELIPVLINAVKELKAENDALRSRVETLEKQ